MCVYMSYKRAEFWTLQGHMYMAFLRHPAGWMHLFILYYTIASHSAITPATEQLSHSKQEI